MAPLLMFVVGPRSQCPAFSVYVYSAFDFLSTPAGLNFRASSV